MKPFSYKSFFPNVNRIEMMLTSMGIVRKQKGIVKRTLRTIWSKNVFYLNSKNENTLNV